MTTSATTQLPIHTTALMALCTDNSQTTRSLHLWRQLDIRTTTCHVSSDSHHSWTACFCHHLCFLLVKFSIEHIMLNLANIEHFAQQLTYLHTRRTNQYWASLTNHQLYLLYHRIVFLALGAIDAVVHIITSDRSIGRNNHHIELVYIPKLTCFSLCRTGHT